MTQLNKCIKTNEKTKIVVFDLDETLGYFKEFGMIWNSLKHYIHIKTELTNKIKIDQELFNKMLDLYPEFLRPNIIKILTYLKKQKIKNHCNQIMIYTNNQGPPEWADYLQHYFENKLNGYKLFDQIIRAYKIGNEFVEICRTSHGKSHEDLLKCTNIPQSTQICFLDDVFHPKMENDQVYYVNVKPYKYKFSRDNIINRFIDNIDKINTAFLEVDTKEKISSTITSFLQQYKHTYKEEPKNENSIDIDKIISKRILEHLHIFINRQIHNKTHKKPGKDNKHYNKTKRIR